MSLLPRTRARGAIALAPLALALGACGSAVTSASFSGERHAVAQAVSDLQSDATAGSQEKICADDLAASVVARLGGKQGCEHAIKEQLAQIDSLETGVSAVTLSAAGRSATATVKSIYSGKTRPATVSLVKERGRWRIAALG